MKPLGGLVAALVLAVPAVVALEVPAPAHASCSYALALTPATQTQVPGGSATVTATLTCGGAPVAGQDVHFHIRSGPDEGFQADATTGSTGQASFTVNNSGHGPGIDVGNAQTTATNPIVFAGGTLIYWQTAILSVTPGHGLPGQVVSFTGSGYAAGETVDLHAGSTSGPVVSTVTADGTGDISGTFTVPPAYALTVAAIGASSGKQGWAKFSQPCTDTWTNPVDGNWTNSADWTEGHQPNEGDVGCITEPGKYTVTMTFNASMGTLILGAPTGTTIQTLDVQANSSSEPEGVELFLDSTSFVNKTGALLLDSMSANDAVLRTNTSPTGVPKALIVHGLFRTVQGGGGNRFIDAGVTISGGRVRIGAVNTFDEAYITNNDGTLSVNAGANLDLASGSSYSQGSAGRLNVVVNATTNAAYGLVDSGDISLAGTLGVTTDGTPSAGQSFTVISGSSVTGTFDSISSSVSYTPAYSPTTVTLTH